MIDQTTIDNALRDAQARRERGEYVGPRDDMVGVMVELESVHEYQRRIAETRAATPPEELAAQDHRDEQHSYEGCLRDMFMAFCSTLKPSELERFNAPAFMQRLAAFVAAEIPEEK